MNYHDYAPVPCTTCGGSGGLLMSNTAYPIYAVCSTCKGYGVVLIHKEKLSVIGED